MENTKVNNAVVTRFVTYKPLDSYRANNATVFTVALTADDEQIESNGNTKAVNALKAASHYRLKCIAETPRFEGTAMTLDEACKFLKGLRLYRDVRRLRPWTDDIIFRDELTRKGIDCYVADNTIYFHIGGPIADATPAEDIEKTSWLMQQIDCDWSYGKTRAVLIPTDKSVDDVVTSVSLTPTRDIRVSVYKWRDCSELIEGDL